MTLNATFIFEIVSFLFLVAVLAKYAYRPIVKIMDERSEQIKADMDKAEGAKIEAERNVKDTMKALEEAKREALRIKEENRKQSEESREKLLRDAEKQAIDIIEQSRRDILTEVEHAKAGLQAFIAKTSVSIAGKILQKEIKEKDHANFIKEGIKNLDKMEEYGG